MSSAQPHSLGSYLLCMYVCIIGSHYVTVQLFLLHHNTLAPALGTSCPWLFQVPLYLISLFMLSIDFLVVASDENSLWSSPPYSLPSCFVIA